jgi:glycosyltransferase involved in cell wall biosynthesis
MKIGLVICGEIDTISGGFLYDRQLVSRLRSAGDSVDIVALPRRSYVGQLADSLVVRLTGQVDILLQDELAHPSLIVANRGRHTAPVISIVHNLRSAERRAGWQNSFYRWVEKSYLKSVDGFVFNSAATRRSVVALIARQLPHVIASPGGDRLGELPPDHIQARAFEGGPLRLLFLANVIHGKGLEVLLAALTSMPRTDYELDVVGRCDVEPGYARRMERIASDHGLPVVFHGPLDNGYLESRLRHAQVLVVPSFYEGFGIAYLEGMAYGLAAIGTTAGAIPELIEDGKNGYLITPGDSDLLARQLRRLAADRALLAHFGAAALRTYKLRPTWGESATRVRDLLSSVLDMRRSDRA